MLVHRLSTGARWGYAKYARKPGDFAGVDGNRRRRPGAQPIARRAGRRSESPALMHASSQLLAGKPAEPLAGKLGAAIEADLSSVQCGSSRLDHAPRDRVARHTGFEMKAITIRVNGERISRSVDDRLSLADFVREHCLLTGTHIGCEHGVCGACTLMMDGQPVRSCITLAAAADGRDVRTVEGYEGDALMQRSARRSICGMHSSAVSARRACSRPPTIFYREFPISTASAFAASLPAIFAAAPVISPS